MVKNDVVVNDVASYDMVGNDVVRHKMTEKYMLRNTTVC